MSPVDRPANGHRFLIVKSEGSGTASEEPMGKDATQKNAGTPPGEAQMAAGGTLAEEQKAPPPAPAAPAAGEAESGEVAMVLPPGAKEPLVGALKSAQGRIGQLVMTLEKATEAEGAEMPSDPVVMVADVAAAMAKAIEPFVMAQAGSGMAAPAEGEVEVDKAAFVPWTQEYIDSLPDCAFLYVEPSIERKDSEWRTIPLTNRKFPVRDHAYRLCLPMVIEAIAQIGASAEPFLSAQKKRRLLLNLASDRLYEASVAAYRDEPMQPETGAELLAVAEMIAGVGGLSAAPAAQPAAAAPGAESAAPPPAMGEGAVEQAAPPVEQQMAAFAKAVSDRIREVAAIGKSESPAAKADVAKGLSEVSAALKAALAKVDEMAGGEEAEKAFPPKKEEGESAEAQKTETAKNAQAGSTPTIDVTKALADKDAEIASMRAEIAKSAEALSKANVAMGKLSADLTATRTQLAKAQRATPASNVTREEPKEVAKSDGKGAFGYVTDLNEIYKSEGAQERQSAKQ